MPVSPASVAGYACIVLSQIAAFLQSVPAATYSYYPISGSRSLPHHLWSERSTSCASQPWAALAFLLSATPCAPGQERLEVGWPASQHLWHAPPCSRIFPGRPIRLSFSSRYSYLSS